MDEKYYRAADRVFATLGGGDLIDAAQVYTALVDAAEIGYNIRAIEDLEGDA